MMLAIFSFQKMIFLRKNYAELFTKYPNQKIFDLKLKSQYFGSLVVRHKILDVLLNALDTNLR